MSENDNNYYAMSYDSTGEGYPVSMAGFFNCEQFEWDPYETNPNKLDIKHDYSINLTSLGVEIKDIDFDFYQVGATYVSKAFLKICDDLGVKYRAVPLELKSGKKTRRGDFFIFLPGESLATMDKERSVYEVSNIETSATVYSPLYPGAVSIDKIEFFVVSEYIRADFFRCQETLELFCSKRFKLSAHNLKGISFVKIDSSYRYDPWAGFDDL